MHHPVADEKREDNKNINSKVQQLEQICWTTCRCLNTDYGQIILVTAAWGVAIFVCYKVSLAPVPISRWLTMADVLKTRCRKLLFKWSPQNNRGDLLMLLSSARGHHTWHDGGLCGQEPPSLMRTMADLKWQHSQTCWTLWRHLFSSCGQLIQVTVELLAVTKLQQAGLW